MVFFLLFRAQFPTFCFGRNWIPIGSRIGPVLRLDWIGFADLGKRGRQRPVASQATLF